MKALDDEHAALLKVLKDHLGKHAAPDYYWVPALRLSRDAAFGAESMPVWDEHAERKRIDRILQLMAELDREIKELHPKVASGFFNVSDTAIRKFHADYPKFVPRRPNHGSLPSSHDFWWLFMVSLLGDDENRYTFQSKEDAARSAATPEQSIKPALSGEKWKRAMIVDYCRLLWQRNVGSAPKWINNESIEPKSTNFGRFLADVFDAVGIKGRGGSPVKLSSAMAAWRELIG